MLWLPDLVENATKPDEMAPIPKHFDDKEVKNRDLLQKIVQNVAKMAWVEWKEEDEFFRIYKHPLMNVIGAYLCQLDGHKEAGMDGQEALERAEEEAEICRLKYLQNLPKEPIFQNILDQARRLIHGTIIEHVDVTGNVRMAIKEARQNAEALKAEHGPLIGHGEEADVPDLVDAF
jgi:hypothetical protein